MAGANAHMGLCGTVNGGTRFALVGVNIRTDKIETGPKLKCSV